MREPVTPVVTVPPKIKVILVEDDVNEMQRLYDQGYKVATAYQHPKGALITMLQEPGDVRIG